MLLLEKPCRSFATAEPNDPGDRSQVFDLQKSWQGNEAARKSWIASSHKLRQKSHLQATFHRPRLQTLMKSTNKFPEAR